MGKILYIVVFGFFLSIISSIEAAEIIRISANRHTSRVSTRLKIQDRIHKQDRVVKVTSTSIKRNTLITRNLPVLKSIRWFSDKPPFLKPDKKNTFAIRRGNQEDVKFWLPLRKELWPGSSEAKHLREIQEYLRDAHSKAVFFAEFELNNPIGFLEVSVRDYAEGCEKGPVGYLEGIYVRESFRQKKIGSQLIGFAENWAMERGCMYMASDAHSDNHISIETHIKSHYTITSKLVHFIKELPTK